MDYEWNFTFVSVWVDNIASVGVWMDWTGWISEKQLFVGVWVRNCEPGYILLKKLDLYYPRNWIYIVVLVVKYSGLLDTWILRIIEHLNCETLGFYTAHQDWTTPSSNQTSPGELHLFILSIFSSRCQHCGLWARLISQSVRWKHSIVIVGLRCFALLGSPLSHQRTPMFICSGVLMSGHSQVSPNKVLHAWGIH